MPTRQHWDALLAVTILEDGTEIAKTRTLKFPTSDFVIAYDQGTDTLTLRVSAGFVGAVTDLSHGERSYSTTGTGLGALLHPLATPDPEGTPGFMTGSQVSKLDSLQAWTSVGIEDDPVTVTFGQTGNIFPGSGAVSLDDIANLAPGPVPLVLMINQSGSNKNVAATGGYTIGGAPSPYVMADMTVRIFVPDAIGFRWGVLTVTV